MSNETLPQPESASALAEGGRIQDHGIIGDSRSAALISRNGSLDWLCWPRFDSPAIFAGLLDSERGGHWRIAPASPCRTTRGYIRDTNVLQTRFECTAGTAILTDLMPVASEEFKRTVPYPKHEITRQVECTSGALQLEVDFAPRANFGTAPVRIRDRGKLGLRMDVGRGAYWLRANVPFQLEEGRARGLIALAAGQKMQFSLTYTEEAPAILPALGEWTDQSIARTIEWWRQWAARANYDGPYRDAVVRSALALKLLTYAPSGAVLAAATTSLPERIGGDLNWDYRYCWLRDASLTIRAMLGLGYREEADDFMEWMLVATRLTRPELKIMYTVFGETAPRERNLPRLRGYRDSRPVRVGNGARHQLQLDVYGEVIDAAAQYAFHGGEFDSDMRKALLGFGDYVMKNWNCPDEGIWEPRNGRQNHTHSRLLCWVALDRLGELAKRGLLPKAPIDGYKKNCEAIANQIRQQAWNERLQSYVSVLGGEDLDASLLLMSWYGFEKADSPRMKSTYRALVECLGAGHGLIYRYHTDPPEGAFAICSFWAAEYFALGGASLDESHDLFRTLLQFHNDLGLYSEEIDARTGEALGNFPQAFTHIGLIGAALSIQEREVGARQLAHRPKEAPKSDTEEVAA